MIESFLALTLVATPAAQKAAFAKDLTSFFSDVDKHCPFLRTKGIKSDWETKKKQLRKRVKKCRTEADLFDLIREAALTLRDGHLAFPNLGVKPNKIEPEFWPGVVFLPATKKRVVIIAAPRTHQSALKPGMVVTKINGKPARKYFEERGKDTWKSGGWFSSPQRATFFEYRRGLRGKRGAKFTLELLDGKKKRKRTIRAEYEVRNWIRSYNPPEGLQREGEAVYHTSLGNVGYMWLRKMSDGIAQEFAKALAAHSRVQSWIIDLRANTGGRYSSSLTKQLREIRKPIIALIDGGTVSAGETFARDLVTLGRAKLYGSRTAGSSGKKRVWKSANGKIAVRYTYRSFTGLKKPIEFHGIEPDIAVEAVPEEVAAGKNSAIERALERLTK